MSVHLTFRVPADAVEFGPPARSANVSVSVEPSVAAEAGRSSVHVRGTATADFGAFETELAGVSTVDEVSLLDEYDDSRRYSVSWTGERTGVFDDLRGAGAHVLSADGDGAAWQFETRFPDDDGLAAFSERCRSTGVSLEIVSLRRNGRREGSSFGLSAEQRETLRAALDAGFYDVPRKTTTVELAETLDISDQSLSERLRRAHATLVENTIE